MSDNYNGFTMVELVVALAIASVMTAVMYVVYTSSAQSFTTQDVAAGVQQSIRVGMEFIARDVRMAGFAPETGDAFGIEEATASKIRFTRDALDTSLTPPEYNGQIDDDNEERITYRLSADNSQMLRVVDEGKASEAALVLLDQVHAMSFTYFDQADNVMAAPVAAVDCRNIRGIEVSISIQEPAGRGAPVSRRLRQRVTLRNVGL